MKRTTLVFAVMLLAGLSLNPQTADARQNFRIPLFELCHVPALHPELRETIIAGPLVVVLHLLFHRDDELGACIAPDPRPL